MSKQRIETMMKLMEMMNGAEEKKERKTPPTQTEGFESLVSKEEYEAISKVKEAFERFIDVHNKNAISFLDRTGHMSPYALLQYSVLSNSIDDAMDEINIMYGIHALDKKAIDELVAESDCDTVKELEMRMSMTLLMKKLRG